MIRLLIADDHQLLLDSLYARLSDENDIEVVALAKNGKEVKNILEGQPVDVILMDINMPEVNGVEACKYVTKHYPETKVIALTMSKNKTYLKRLVSFGVSGYMLKSDNAEDIIEAIHKGHNGEKVFSKNLQSFLLEDLQRESYTEVFLTKREEQVRQLISEGMTNSQIAEKLFVSQHTVDSHRKNLLLKFQVNNTAALVKHAMEKGII